MRIAIMQPYLFPYLGYFQLINAVDNFVIYDDVKFIKNGWINRNYILANGNKNLFKFSLKKDSSSLNIDKRFFSIKISDEIENFIKTLQFAYHKAPYFNESYRFICNLLSTLDPSKNVGSNIGNTIIKISEYLGIKTKFIFSSNLNYSQLQILKGQTRVLEIVKVLKGLTYINALGGKSLYSKETFKNKNIVLYFLEPLPFQYKQFNNEFIPNLSIIDVMMFNSQKKIYSQLKQFRLK
jgi:hypothetical protein